MTYRIGITGRMGSGKSTVGAYLQMHQIPVLDTDAVVHELYQEPAVIAVLEAQFGSESIDMHDGVKTVNRQRLGAIVFQDAQKRAALEQLIHPLVRARTESFLQVDDDPIRAVLVPLLFESGSEGLYDETWAITVSPESELIQRLHRRHPAWSRDQVLSRLSAQWPQEEKAARATLVLTNDSTPEALLAQVEARLTVLRQQHSQGAQV